MPDSPPPCLGDPELHSPRATECVGGYDPGFTGPDGGHTRPKCPYFESCRMKVTLTKANQQQGAMIPPSTLIRQQPWQAQQPQPQSPWQPTWQAQQPQQQPWQARPLTPHPWQQPPPAMVPGRQQVAQPWQQPAAQPQPWQPPWQQPVAPQQQQQMPPWYGPPPSPYPNQFPLQAQMNPIQFQATHYGMPAYLSVPENRSGSFIDVMKFELLRGMGKAFGHGLAHVFDTFPFRR